MTTRDAIASEDVAPQTRPWVFDADGHVVEPPRVHADGTFPGATRDLLETRDLDHTAIHRVLRDNALRLYGFDG